ncbi:hypothetical protein fugu_010343 [Takifugu bimaculatus]|uniref:Homocysteine-responsive endoplasmic reticulum-resident ubiquitin-like domain member 2 protein n=1 Tax=Takifugu bimaculatus TaxID=433685 RepID=A0A4Z2CF67_9TELE|nr:hypothetical protein fugu_010343 [Takifugu bimaculatus]
MGTMDPGALDSPVIVVIKAPNQNYEDQTINCFLDWTVERLKNHISIVYPSKPRSKDQRLVYSGRLLQDHLQLRDVLRKQDEYHMMHLKAKTDRGIEATPPFSTLRHPLESPSGGAQVPLQGGVPAPLYVPLQMLWWQQMYARHYYMQYQAAVAASQPLSAAPPASASSPPHQPDPPNEGVQPNPDPLPQNQPADRVQMNAQGGAALNDDELNRDWLDWLYTVSRAGVLLSIVYFYSSFSRFVMVVGAMLLVYLHQAGWFPFRADLQNLRGEPGRAPQEEAGGHQDMHEMERLMDEGMEEDEGGEEGGAEEQPQVAADDAAVPELSFVTMVWSFSQHLLHLPHPRRTPPPGELGKPTPAPRNPCSSGSSVTKQKRHKSP